MREGTHKGFLTEQLSIPEWLLYVKYKKKGDTIGKVGRLVQRFESFLTDGTQICS